VCQQSEAAHSLTKRRRHMLRQRLLKQGWPVRFICANLMRLQLPKSRTRGFNKELPSHYTAFFTTRNADIWYILTFFNALFITTRIFCRLGIVSLFVLLFAWLTLFPITLCFRIQRPCILLNLLTHCIKRFVMINLEVIVTSNQWSGIREPSL